MKLLLSVGGRLLKPHTPSGLIKTLLVLVAVLSGIIVALLTGMLASAGGDELSSAIVSGGVGFAGSVSLVLLIEKSLGLL